MRRIHFLVMGVASLATVSGLASGCKGNSQGSFTKDEEKQFRAPLGQPMPAEARAAMEKMKKDAAASAPTNSAPAPR